VNRQIAKEISTLSDEALEYLQNLSSVGFLKHKKEIKAFGAGKSIEIYSDHKLEGIPVNNPEFWLDCKYRIAKQTQKVVNVHTQEVVEVPAAMKEKPKRGERYWTYAASSGGGTDFWRWTDDYMDNQIFKNKRCFATEEDAREAFEGEFGKGGE